MVRTVAKGDRFRRYVAVTAGCGVLVTSLWGSGAAAVAVPASDAVKVDVAVISDGTPGWSQAPGASGKSDVTTEGYDAGPHNGVVRVNDVVTYGVNLNMNSPTDLDDVTVEFEFPQGVEADTGTFDQTCPAGWTLSPEDTGLDGLLPIDDSTFGQLKAQTVSCNLGDFAQPNQATMVQFTGRVLNASPNNQQLAVGGASVAATDPDDGESVVFVDPDPAVSADAANLGSTTLKASSRLMWDISKNAVQLKENTGTIGSQTVACRWDESRTCQSIIFSRYISAPVAKGAMPALGEVTYGEDLSITNLLPGISDADVAAIEGDLDRYGPRLYQGDSSSYLLSKWGSCSTYSGCVWDSGVTTYVDAGGENIVGTGDPVDGIASAAITGADWTLRQVPSAAAAAYPTALPDPTVAYAVAGVVTIYLPLETFTEFGSRGSDGSFTLKVENRYRDFRVTGLKDAATGIATVETSAGQPATQGYSDGTWNDYRSLNVATTAGQGSFSKGFYGAAGYAYTHPYRVGWDNYPGPAGDWTSMYRSGEISQAAGATVMSGFDLGPQHNIVGPDKQASLLCDAWDADKLWLKASAKFDDPIPDGAATQAVAYAADGQSITATTTLGNKRVQTVQYSSAPVQNVDDVSGVAKVGAAARCGEDSGPWFDTPEEANGGPGEVQADGAIVYKNVTRVRAFVVTERGDGHVFVFIGQQVADGLADGTVIPNYAAGKIDKSGVDLSLDQLVEDESVTWADPTYNPSTNAGTYGDRLISSSALVRLTKQVQVAKFDRESGEYVLQDAPTASTGMAATYANGTPGDQAVFTLQPTLSNAVGMPDGSTADVMVEDCLPSSLTYSTATQGDQVLAPQVVQTGGTLPDDATITCDMSQNSYLRFTLAGVEVNTPLDPIVVTTSASATASSGSFVNSAGVSSPADSSPASVRDATATVTMVTTPAVSLMLSGAPPVVQTNRSGQTTDEQMTWNVVLGNTLPDPTGLTDPRVIVKLPVSGIDGSAFGGDLSLDEVEMTGDTSGVTLLYTSTPASQVVTDPTDASNGPTGSTTWCVGTPPAMTVVSGTGSCPASLAEVTGVRLQGSGGFGSGERLGMTVTMTGTGNAVGNQYVLSGQGYVSGLQFPVGPITAPITVAASSLGDVVWEDTNGNGLQDEGEPGLPNVEVTLSGQDDLGNTVNLSTFTDTTGAYSFAGLRSSDEDGYTVSVVKPSGYVFTAQDVDEDASQQLDSDVESATGAVTVPVGVASSDGTWDTGLYKLSSLGHRVWSDNDADGAQDEGEPGVPGVQVCLSGNTGRGEAVVAPDGTEPYCVITDSEGGYRFEDLPPSDETGYTVTFAKPADGAAFTSRGGSSADGTDSNADPGTGTAQPVVVASGTSDFTIDAGVVGDLTAAKSSSPGEGNAVEAGDDITYTLTFTETTGVGGTPLSYTDDLTAVLDDATLSGAPVASSVEVAVALADDGQSFIVAGALDPGETVTVTYTVTVQKGGDQLLGNLLYATPDDGGIAPVVPDLTTDEGRDACLEDRLCTVHFVPSVMVEKIGSVEGGDSVGDLVTWDFTITNTGPLALADFSLADSMPADTEFKFTGCLTADGLELALGDSGDEAGPPAQEAFGDLVLQPGEVFTCQGNSKVRQADLDQGEQVNPNVTVVGTSLPPVDPDTAEPYLDPETGEPLTGAEVTDEAQAVVPVLSQPGVAMSKSVDTEEAALGDVVTWTLAAQNTGNTNLVDVVVDDPLEGLSPLTCVWPAAEGKLAPGDTVTCQATYVITQADVDNGRVANVATVAGDTPELPGDPDDSEEPAVPADPGGAASGPAVSGTDEAEVAVSLVPSATAGPDAGTGGSVMGVPAGVWALLALTLMGLAVLGGTVVARRRE